MKTTIGIDLGTNSIGWAIREQDTGKENQIIDSGVLVFDKGVASAKGIEFPKVQKRTQSRGQRRNYQSEKYRKFTLLEFLISKKMCPLTIEELDKWRKYRTGKKREYPQSEEFVNWLRFDFDADGKPDFKLFDSDKHDSYYVFRALAIDKKWRHVFSKNPYILGRVFYHLVQRRGFKGRDEKEADTMLKGSSKTSTLGRNQISKYIEEFETLGAALYYYQKENGKRIRNRYNLRKDYEFELKKICEIQGINNEDYKKLWKAIIWQRPLKTQKGMIGLCTFEKNKRRVALSHPIYQEYKTWVLINNLKITAPENVTLERYLQESIYPLFIRKSDFEISHIVKQITKDGATIESKYGQGRMQKTKIVALSNFYDFESLFGEKWKDEYEFETSIFNRSSEQKGNKGKYTIEDLWHILHTFDDKEKLVEFAKEKLALDNRKAIKFSEIKLASGYSPLSLSAVKRILPYLKKGIKYSTAVYLANLPKVLGENEVSEELINYFVEEVEAVEKSVNISKSLNQIVNSLIKEHLEEDYRYYIEDDRDLDDIEKKKVLEKVKSVIGTKTWNTFDKDDRKRKLKYVESHFRSFLKKERTYNKGLFLPQPRFHEKLFEVLKTKYDLPAERIKFLWHPSEQEKYPNATIHRQYILKGQSVLVLEHKAEAFHLKNPSANDEFISLKLLGSPEPISKGFKNPMALKTLHILKKLLNYLLQSGKIDENSRVVVEIARELNDANMRAAIETYQRNREKENVTFSKHIEEINRICKTNYDPLDETLIRKIRLCKEQGNICLYTGKTINECDLFNASKFDIEHTIPATMSFDSELKNLTLADTHYNRALKKKQIPTQMANFDEDAKIDGKSYTAIAPRLEFMKKKIGKLEADLKDSIRKVKFISDKERKDDEIQNRHIIKFNLDYWKKKYDTFTTEEYKSQWKNSQLRDTQTVTKYALPYLKTVFRHVSVQKGTVVNDFKYIYKVLLDNKKDRDMHVHHAIDAAILTLIPTNYYREKELEEYNKAKESKKKYHSIPVGWDNFKPAYIINIEKEIVANKIVDDRRLKQTFKKARKRGKVQYSSNVDANGNRLPIFAKGDTIRGQLHGETFYGTIKQPKRNDKGVILRDSNKKIVFQDVRMVLRKPLVYKKDSNSPGFKTLEDIEKVIVDKALFEQIKLQVGDQTLKEVLSEGDGIWMLDKNGHRVNKIRRIRCFENSIKYKSTNSVHAHTFQSEKEYKQFTYSKNEENPYCLFYEEEIGGKTQRGIKILSLFDLSQMNIKNKSDIEQEPYFQKVKIGKNEITLKKVLKKWDKFIFYKKSKEELMELSKKSLLSRLYQVYEFELDGRMKFRHHLLGGNLTEVKKRFHEETNPEFSRELTPLLRLSKAKWNFALEGVDFEIKIDGEIKWLI